MTYLVARLGFVFPAIAVEERYSLRLAWQHTAGQGSRMTAALFVAGFPSSVAQLLLPALLLDSLLGVSFSELPPAMPAPGAELPPPAELSPRASASAGAILPFALISSAERRVGKRVCS